MVPLANLMQRDSLGGSRERGEGIDARLQSLPGCPMPQIQFEDLQEQILSALAAWHGTDPSILADRLSDEVVFGSPTTEWIDASALARGKAEVLSRFEEERGSVGELKLVDILIGPDHLTILLRDGDRVLTCLVELDADGKFRRLIPSVDWRPEPC
jgi:hypothetical protein